MTQYTLLFYIGVILIGIAIVGAILGSVILLISSRRLKVQLEKEFGKRKR